jgi:membrane-bound acyltransferase YfiQ involved in biofilm formation
MLPNLDLGPLFLTTAAIAALAAFLLGLAGVWTGEKRGVGVWMGARVLLMAGALVHFTATFPGLRLLVFPGFMLIYLALVTDYVGHCRFLGRPAGAWPMLLVCAVVTILLMLISRAYGPVVGVIMGLSMVAQILLISPILLTLLRHREASLRAPLLLTSLSYAVLLVVPMIRLAFFARHGFQLGVENGAVGLALLLSGSFVAIQTVSLIWMIRARARAKTLATP